MTVLRRPTPQTTTSPRATSSMAVSDADRLRTMLADSDAASYVFTDDQIQDMILQAGDDLERAAFDGWRNKAAYYADLVDVTEGNASRSMSDLHDHALAMMKIYASSRGGPTEGRTRIGHIVRRF